MREAARELAERGVDLPPLQPGRAPATPLSAMSYRSTAEPAGEVRR